MVIDTPGIDDEGELGALRVRKSFQVLNKTDIAVLVVDINTGKTPCEEMCIRDRATSKRQQFMVSSLADWS